jgi:hypothetical protein
MTMKRWMMAVCATMAASSGCTTSTVQPEAEITLSGKVLKEDGQPLADTLLNMTRSANSSCSFSIFGGLSWKKVKTESDGTFRLELLGADTQNGSTARCFELQVPGSGRGSNMSAAFLVQTEQVQVPVLQPWGFNPTATAGTGSVSVSFQDISAIHQGTHEGHTLHVTKRSGGAVWIGPQVQSPVVVNDELLEDATDLQASISVYRKITASGTTFTLYNSGDPVALPARSRVPVSRGASCTYPSSPATCPLTDGDLSSPVTFPEGTREVVIQLPQPKVLRKAVLRQLFVFFTPRELVLEGSADGTNWVALANLLDGSSPLREYHELTLSHSTPLSQVRVRAAPSGSNDYIQKLSELSLFE